MSGRNMLELLFDDGSDNPYCIHLGVEQTDRLLPKSEHGRTGARAGWLEAGARRSPVGATRGGHDPDGARKGERRDSLDLRPLRTMRDRSRLPRDPVRPSQTKANSVMQ
jgi:hypothetical protein